MWRDQTLMLQLQRGEPVIYMNPADASERGIAEQELVRVWNDMGEFLVRAKITPAIRPSQVHILHAWEPYQFRGGKSEQEGHEDRPDHVRPPQSVCIISKIRTEGWRRCGACSGPAEPC